MHLSKKDVDVHVSKVEEMVSSDYQRNLKGFEIAKMYFDVGAFDSCLKYLTLYLSVRESSFAAYRLKGKVCESLGSTESALSAYKRAYQLNPSVSEVLLSIVRLQVGGLKSSEVEEARFWYDKAAKVAPSNSAVSTLYDAILLYEKQGTPEGQGQKDDDSATATALAHDKRDSDHQEAEVGNQSAIDFFSTPKPSSSSSSFSHRRFPARLSPEKLSAQVKQLESKHESYQTHLEEKFSSLSRALSEVLYEVRQNKTIIQNVATEMTLLKVDLKDRDEIRVKDITSAVAATTAAVASLQKTHKDPEEDVITLKQRLRESEKESALHQAAFLQFASSGAGHYAQMAAAAAAAATVGGVGVVGGGRPPTYPAPPPPHHPIRQPHQPHWLPAEPLPMSNFAPVGAGGGGGGPPPAPPTIPRVNQNAAPPPSNIVISSSDKIPLLGKDAPVPTFSGSVTIPPEHRLGGLRPLPSASNHSFQINLANQISNTTASSFTTPTNSNIAMPPILKDETAVTPSSSFLSRIPDPVVSAVVDPPSDRGGARMRQASVNSTCTEEEEIDPCPDFKPIIPLPEEVDIVTGEEEEDVLFEERSKLYRFTDKEWKERGLGSLKILKHTASGKIRVIMRREQTHKICANHHILPDINIEKMKNQEKAVTWSANDFSDEEVRIENFSARFKTPDLADKFLEVFQQAKADIARRGSGGSPVKKDEVTLSNGGSKVASVGTIPHETSPLNKVFMPKPGSWECSQCYTRNDSDKVKCVACQIAQPGKEGENVNKLGPEASKAPTILSFGSGGGFSYTPPTGEATPTSTTVAASPFSWASNSGTRLPTPVAKSNSSTPVAPKTGAATNGTTEEAGSATSKPSPFSSFSFGMPSSSTTGFNFNTPSKNESETKTTTPFGGTTPGSKVEDFSFSLGKLGEEKKQMPIGEGVGGSSTYNLTSPNKLLSTSPNKLLSDTKNEDSYVEDEEHDPCPDFKPIIPLPKEVEVVTGEEEEDVIFVKRSKLLRLANKEWKERGIGELKILKHRVSNRVRLLMRRDQTLKVCANHILHPEIKVERNKLKNTAVIWVAKDFSDEEMKLEQFCAQFKSPEIATEFMEAFNESKVDIGGENEGKTKDNKTTPPTIETLGGSLEMFKPKPGSWECPGCMCRNEASVIKCPACETIQPGKEGEVETTPKKDETVKWGSIGTSGFIFPCQKMSPSATPDFVFGSGSTTITSQSVVYKPPSPVAEEAELSFKSQMMKLDDAHVAKDVALKIRACKAMHILTLSGNTIGVEAAEVLGSSLEVHPELRRAHWKDIFTGRMKTEIPPALKHLSNGIMTAGAKLVELDLSDNAFGPIGMEGIKDLITSEACYSLKELRLNNTGCGVTGGEYLARLLETCLDKSTKAGYPLSLKVFVLGRSRQENNGAIALAKVFKRMGSLEEVIMPQNGIYHKGISALMDAFQNNPRLRILDLNDNTFTTKGAKSLADALPAMTQLEVLNIGDCLIRSLGAGYIAMALRDGHPNLRELCMDSNDISENSGMEIVDAIANKPKLETLCIDGNMFGEEGCKLILDYLSQVGKGDLEVTLEEDQGSHSEEDSEEEEDDHHDHLSNGGGTASDNPSTPLKTEGIFGNPTNIFSGLNGLSSPNLFGDSSKSKESSTTPIANNNIFGSKIFGGVSSSDPTASKTDTTLSLMAADSKLSTTGAGASVFSFGNESSTKEGGGSLFASTNLPSFASLSDENGSIFSFGNKDDSFSFVGAGSNVFAKSKAALDTSKASANDNFDESEHDHDPYFEPIISLPELVEVTTGEEEEKVVFKHRAKVYRYDTEGKEWKERGIGDLKILHHEGRGTFRVLMRREQILKIACNHLINKDMVLKPLLGSSNSLCWFAMDFSEEESKMEQLAVKFKTVATTEEYKKIFNECQAKLNNNES